jgi:hypothetical protein
MRMLHSKKFWIVGLVLFLSGILIWVWLTGHSVPSTARYLPADVKEVLTINSKRLMTDLLFEKTPISDTSGTASKYWKRWNNAMTANGGIGISISADILSFNNVSKAHAIPYSGIIFKVKDELLLGNFLIRELPRLVDSTQTHITSLLKAKGYNSLVIVNDENQNPICIGFNKEVLVVLRSGQGITDPTYLNTELNRIFHLTKDSSLYVNENFRETEKHPADLCYWLKNSNPLDKFFRVGGDTLAETGYTQAWLNFKKGELTLEICRKVSGRQSLPQDKMPRSAADFINYVATDKFIGICYANLDRKSIEQIVYTGNKYGHLFDNWGVKTEDLISCMDGSAALAFNGFIHYPEKYTVYDYDENFNQVEVERMRDARLPGFTLSLGTKGIEAKARLFLKLLANKTLIPSKNGFRLNIEAPVYVYTAGDHLFITSSDTPPAIQTRQLAAKEELKKQMMEHSSGFSIDLKELENQYRLAFQVPQASPHLSDVFQAACATAEEEPTKTTCKLVITCKDRSANALPQLLGSRLLDWFIEKKNDGQRIPKSTEQ